MLAIWHRHRQLFAHEYDAHTRNYCIVSSLCHRPSLLPGCFYGYLTVAVFQDHCHCTLLHGLQQLSPGHPELFSGVGELWVWNRSRGTPLCGIMAMFFQQTRAKIPLYIMCWLENTLHNFSFNLDDVMRLHLPPMNRFSWWHRNTQFTCRTHTSASAGLCFPFGSISVKVRSFFRDDPFSDCSIIKPWILISGGSRESRFRCALSSPLRKASMTVGRQTTCERCPLLFYPHPSLLSWRCIQWERPNALLEERERFIKDWWDCALSVFCWRLPAFLWACLLQQYRYVRLEAGVVGGLSALYLGWEQPESS